MEKTSYVDKIIKEFSTKAEQVEEEVSSFIEYKLSVQKPDRYNDIIMVEGIDTKNFLANPVVLREHDTNRIVGKAKDLRTAENALFGSVEFQEETQDGKETKALAEKGFINAVSIGFLPKSTPKEVKIDEEMRKSGEFYPYTDTVRIFEKTELVEFSLVATPANPYALQNSLDEVRLTERSNAIGIKRYLIHLDEPLPIETKVGAVLNKRNLSRLEEIINLALAILEESQPNEEEKALSTEEVEEIVTPEEVIKPKRVLKKNKLKSFTPEMVEDLLNKIKE